MFIAKVFKNSVNGWSITGMSYFIKLRHLLYYSSSIFVWFGIKGEASLKLIGNSEAVSELPLKVLAPKPKMGK